MSVENKVAAVHKYVEAFEKADIQIIKDIYADDAVVEDPVGTDPHHGIEAICQFYENGFAMGAKLKLNGAVRCAENSAAFPFTVDAGGMRIEVIDVFEFNDDDKVVSMKAYWGPENMVS